jgi:hypothetical protein
MGDVSGIVLIDVKLGEYVRALHLYCPDEIAFDMIALTVEVIGEETHMMCRLIFRGL